MLTSALNCAALVLSYKRRRSSAISGASDLLGLGAKMVRRKRKNVDIFLQVAGKSFVAVCNGLSGSTAVHIIEYTQIYIYTFRACYSIRTSFLLPLL